MSNIYDKMLRFQYSSDLHYHLQGLKIDCQDNGTSFYTSVLLVLLFTSAIIIINYYYILFNRPKFSGFWVWFLNIIISCIIVFCYAIITPKKDLNQHKYCQQLHFNSTDCFLFGLTAFVYTLIFCLIFSILIKWWSLNNKKTPF